MRAAARAADPNVSSSYLLAIGSHAHSLQEAWANLLTLITRIEWAFGQAIKKELPIHAWMDFTAPDLEHFHVELRSAFDDLARIVIAQSKEPGQTPKESYNRLSKWAEECTRRAGKVLGVELAQAVVESRKLFLDRKRIRESVVHSGARVFVFPPTEGILFQVYADGLQLDLLTEPGDLMHNEHVVDFKRYASSTPLQFWVLVEDVSTVTFSRYGLPQVGSGDGVMSYHGDPEVMRKWSTDRNAARC